MFLIYYPYNGFFIKIQITIIKGEISNGSILFHFYTHPPIPRHTGYGKRHGTPTKSNALLQLATYPHSSSTYTERLPHEGGTFSNASEMFFSKNENFFSIRKCINWEKRKVHSVICKAKLFLTVIF